MLEWIEAEVAESLVLRLSASPAGLCAIQFGLEPPAEAPFGVPLGPGAPSDPSPQNPLLVEALSQLRAYFAGRLREFRLPLSLAGTDFQIRVWRHLQTIPYGQTRSYSAIAQAIGRPSAVRAVGAANGANPVPIVVPCHRVIGANGKLVGYGGGLPLKRRLLELERMDETILRPPG
ncbi:MAG: methylated-DNA--[protein]-cysteine S-methyltransferase [Bryobacteraceae bacterium]